jgi:hypothetical protein
MNTGSIFPTQRSINPHGLSRARASSGSGSTLLPQAMAKCSAWGASELNTFSTKQRLLVAGVAPHGIAISDGEWSCLVSEAELECLLCEVEQLS